MEYLNASDLNRFARFETPVGAQATFPVHLADNNAEVFVQSVPSHAGMELLAVYRNAEGAVLAAIPMRELLSLVAEHYPEILPSSSRQKPT